MDAAFFSESRRLEALAQYDITGTPPEPAFDEIAALAARLCDAPQGYVTFVDADRVWFKAAAGVDSRGVERAASLCPLLLETRKPLIIPDTRRDPRSSAIAAVTHHGINFYAGVPITSLEGHVLGSLCVCGSEPRELSEAQLETLSVLSRQVMAQLELRKQAGALRRAEWLARTALQVGKGAAWMVDVARGTVTGDPMLARYFNIPTERCRSGEPIASYLDAIHEEDRALVSDAVGHSVETGEPYDVEFRAFGADGEMRWFHSRGRMDRDAAGKSAHMPGMILDITARRAAEQAQREGAVRLRLATEAAHLGIFVWHVADDRVTWENEQVYRQFGRTAADGTVNMAEFAEKIVHPDDRADFENAIARALDGDTPFFFQGRFLRKDGAMRSIEFRGQLTRAADGTPLWMLGTTADITEQRQAEAALRSSKDRAESASRAKDDFLAALSHELRTPLTPVLMTAAALSEDERLPADARADLKMIERNIALEARLIDDLLDLTSISRGKLTLRAEPCDVHTLLSLAVEIVRDEAQAKPVALALDLAAHHTRLQGDPARLQQVFWNLLRNAIKFTPERGSIAIRTRDAAGDWLRVEVQDTGLGLAPETLETIFHPFEQVQHRGDHRFGGLGLGLAIARAIVHLHGGAIRAESAGRGCGATFIVELPGATERRGGSLASSDGRYPGPPMANEPGLRLLLVEDHEPTLAILSRLLTRAGHRVVTAHSVATAVAAAEAADFDVVISDLGLPDGTGLEAMGKLRAIQPRIGGIALSGYGMEDDLRRSLGAGFSTHLIKPVDFDQLRRALRDAALISRKYRSAVNSSSA